MSMSIQELTERKTRNVRDVISTLKLLLKSWDDKATPRRSFKGIRWSLVCAIEICEKQEPKKPTFFNGKNFNTRNCPTCRIVLVDETNYCSECGQKLDWSR